METTIIVLIGLLIDAAIVATAYITDPEGFDSPICDSEYD